MSALILPRQYQIDEFTGANGDALDSNLWEVGGSGSNITYDGAGGTKWNGTADGNRYAKRNFRFHSENQYVSCTTKGDSNSTKDSRLAIKVSNSGSGSGVYLNWFSNKIYLGRLTGSWTSTSDWDDIQSGISIPTGTLIELWNQDNLYFVRIGGVFKWNGFTGVSAPSGADNRTGAFGQSRGAFNNSCYLENFIMRDL